ncbi:MAG: hypothetical protein H7Z40_18820 [Phycisphaerae bacterium]|nr:hypothetical protein [Gemmatimonadaceae bacterium]
MSPLPPLAPVKGHMESAFGTLLAETLLEMEAAELMDAVPDDAVHRLSLETQQAVVSQTGRPLPRVGGASYRMSTVTPPAQTRSQLDVRY